MKAPPPRQKRWVVRPGDGATVSDILRKAGDDARAVTEGRVFVGRNRVTHASAPVKVGDEVKIGAPRSAVAPSPGSAPGSTSASSASPSAASAASASVSVLFDRDGLLACRKPAGIPTVPDHAGASHSLVALAALATGRTTADLHVTSRLDREVSGVVVFATTSEAEARLRGAREQGRYTRRYLAIAAVSAATPATRALLDADPASTRLWEAPIGAGKDPRHRAAGGPGAKAAQTRWQLVARAGELALLVVEPQTGRTHQIRVHASHAGMPLLGDRDYGGPARTTLPGGRVVALGRIALHAARVTVPDAQGGTLTAEDPVPPELANAWAELGGAPEAWDRALSCALEPSG